MLRARKIDTTELTKKKRRKHAVAAAAALVTFATLSESASAGVKLGSQKN